MRVMRGCHLAKAEPIRGLSSTSGKFRQSGNYFWIKNIKGFGFRFFPHLELTCLLRIHCGARGCESNAIHTFISVASHFTFSRWLSSPPRYHFLSVQENEPAHHPSKPHPMGAIQPQLKQQAFHRTCRTMLNEELRYRRHRAVCWAYRCLLRSPPLHTLNSRHRHVCQSLNS